ncbi:MAG TPA: S8 family serine peptidase [Candidatus Aveggerthella excrementigallinarum]|nr:S8 family serine peptidase [Candidatus Aveggerthella excrementigallinarum]
MVSNAKRFVACVCAVALASALVPMAGVAEAIEDAQAAQAAAQQAAEGVATAVAEGAAVEGELIVVLEDGADAGATARDASVDVQVEQLADEALLVTAEGSDAADTAALAERLSQDDAVAYVQPNFVYAAPEGGAGEEAPESAQEGAGEGTPENAANDVDSHDAATNGADSHGVTAVEVPASAGARATVVNDPLWSSQSYLAATGFDDAWDGARANGTVSVAVLDSAVSLVHEELAATLDVEHGWDAVNQVPLGTAAASNHGTEVAGIISAACDNATGIAGASYGANIVPVTVLSGSGLSTTTAVLYRAMNYLFQLDDEHPELNLRVLNMSFGGYGTGQSSVMDRAFYTLVKTAVEERDMAVVAAGGNEHTASFSWPADWDEVVSVTSVDASLQQPASFSDHNEHKDIAAPGEQVMATTAQGVSSYGTCRGTSFSAPIVSAALSLMFAANPALSATHAVELLYQTADDRGAAGRDEYFGWGLVNAEAAVGAVLEEASEHPSLRFADIDQSAWYQTPVAYIDTVVGAGLMQGYAGLFRPDDSITRAEVFAIMYRASGAGSIDEPPAADASGFRDNASYQWYTAAINWAAGAGLAQGSDGLVRPDDAITREEVSAVMARYTEYMAGVAAAGDPVSLQFAADWQAVSSWATSTMAWATEHGILSGRLQPDGALLLAPRANATRAEFAKIITQTLEAVE